MSNKDFLIPISRDDLLVESRSAYYVRNILPLNVLPERLEDVKAALAETGYLCIFNQFDTLFSALSRFPELDHPTNQTAWKITIKIFESLSGSLGAMLDQGDMSHSVKKEHCNALKMICYLVSQFIGTFAKPLRQPLLAQKSKGRKSTKSKHGSNGGVSWNGCQERGLHAIEQMLEMDVHRLWDPPILEENFVTCVTSCCYKVLENPDTARQRETRELIFRILGITIVKCNHTMGAVLKIIQLLQDYEHLCTPLAEAVEYYGRQLGVKTVVIEFIREIGKLDHHDLSRDTSGTRSLATFVTEMGERLPDMVLPVISCLLRHLDGENYSMRNAVLSTLAEIVIQVLSDPSQSDVAKATRDEFLEKLMEHIHDVNAFSRSKCIQNWQNLFKKQAIPLSVQQRLVPKVVDRLQDKSSNVRKYSIQFLTVFLCSNPFSNKLSSKQAEKGLEEAQKKLISTEEETLKDVQSESESVDGERLMKQRQLIAYLKDAVDFIHNVEKAIPMVAQLLNSKMVTDVLEAMNFFITCHEFGIEGAQVGIRKMFVLIWSKEAGVKDAVVNSFKRLYLDGPKSSAVAGQLISLTENLNVAEMTSLEELIRLLMVAKEISKDVIQRLWQVFATKTEQPMRQRGAIMLLGMAASAEPDIVKSNMELLVSHGLDSNDLEKTKYSCIALQKTISTKKSMSEPPLRLSPKHFLIERLKEIVMVTFNEQTAGEWVAFSCHAIKTIYALSDQPDSVGGELLKLMAKSLMESCHLNKVTENPSETDIGEPLAQSTQDPDQECVAQFEGFYCSSTVMARFLAVSGQIALSQLVHVDVHVNREMKRRQSVKDKTAAKTPAKTSKRSKSSGRASLSIEAEMGMDQTSAEDQVSETLRQICESEIVTGSGLLAVLRPFIVSICGQPSKYPYVMLQSAAATTLAKFMLVSSEFCEAHLQLFFTILQKSAHPVIRANAMVAVSDMAVRFPNLIEPWTPHLYSRLRDESVDVRKNTLLVLSRLVLNDMIKVKGQISEMAFCLEDENPFISRLSRLFFHDFAQKGNALYNVLPDIISHLSDPENCASQPKFSSVMKYLMSFIQKERQTETLIEKLCHRFKTLQTERQACDLSFCLLQLSFSEKGIRKLQENLPCFQEQLNIPEVYSNFAAILSKAKKFSKPEAKALLYELESVINKIHAKGVEQDETAEKASNASKKARGHKGKKAVKSRSTMASVESSEENGEFEKLPAKKSLKSTVKCGKRKKIVRKEESDSDVDLFALSDSDAENWSPDQIATEVA
eukprot:m.217644 g.217644  ORF g.217644 m.217644 type:complete len:1269 (+) comp39883_c1_seq40:407-4213(+)